MAAHRILIDFRNPQALQRSLKNLSNLGSISVTERNRRLRKLSRHVEVFYVRPMIRELKKQPPKRMYPDQYPIEYTTEKQRRYVWWAILSDGVPYEQTNEIVDSYEYKIKVRDGRVSIKIENTSESSKYVVGLIGLGKSQSSIRRYTRDIQEFNKITGYQPAYIPVQKYIARAEKKVNATIREWFR